MPVDIFWSLICLSADESISNAHDIEANLPEGYSAYEAIRGLSRIATKGSELEGVFGKPSAKDKAVIDKIGIFLETTIEAMQEHSDYSDNKLHRELTGYLNELLKSYNHFFIHKPKSQII